MRARLRALDPNVRAMGWVSFVADLSSEIVYPLFPLFVTGVLGAPVAVLGFIEGVAEATATVLRYPFGRLSDRLGRRRPFVLAGYGLSGLGKLVIALAGVWGVALAGRVVDRMGKGIRTAPRDALIGAGTKPGQQGLAFGLHRSMDTMGAALGPLIALVALEAGLPLRWVLGLAVIPALLSVVVILVAVRERRLPPSPSRLPPALCRPRRPTAGCSRARCSSPSATRATCSCCSRPSDVGLGTSGVILVYVLYNLIYAAASLPLGGLSDRIGQLPLVLGGYVVFAAVYAGFAVGGLVAGGGGPLRRLRPLHRRHRGHEQGAHQPGDAARPSAPRRSASRRPLTGLASLVASSLGGVLWTAVGPWATFAFGAVCALAAAAVLAAGRGRVRDSLAVS